MKRDLAYFDQEKQRMMTKILNLTTQIDEFRQEADRYKRIWDKVKHGIKNAKPVYHQQRKNLDSSVDNSL